MLPAITRVEFTTFHNALFAAENDASLDFVTLIKVAEALGSELVSYSIPQNGDTFDLTHPLPPQTLTTEFENDENEAPPTVDYSVLEANPTGRKRVMEALGFNVAGGDSFGERKATGPAGETLGDLASCGSPSLSFEIGKAQ